MLKCKEVSGLSSVFTAVKILSFNTHLSTQVRIPFKHTPYSLWYSWFRKQKAKVHGGPVIAQ